jgi:hypothetical protein
MELRQNIRHATTRPMALVVAILSGLILGLMVWYVRPITTLTHPTIVRTPIVTSVESPRSGGPGGQIGDAPQPDQTTRVGGPGGQFGDAP